MAEFKVQRSAVSYPDRDDVLSFFINCEFCQSFLFFWIIVSETLRFLNKPCLFSNNFSDFPFIARRFEITTFVYEHPWLLLFFAQTLNCLFASHVIWEFIPCADSFAVSGMKKLYSAASLLSQVLCFSALLIVNLLKSSAHTVVVFVLGGDRQGGG